MKRYLLLTALLFTLALQAASAQDPAAERAVDEHAGWKTVLAPGTLGRNPEIVPVAGGFAISAESFEDPTWFFDSDWVLYDPVVGDWSDYEFPQAAPALLDLDEELLILLDIADLVPDDPRIKYQLIDGGVKLAFLLPDEYNFQDLSLYTTVLLVDPVKRTAKRENVWYCPGPPAAELTVWDFPQQDHSVVCNAVIHHRGDSMGKEYTFDFIGSRDQGPLYLYSHSLDNRYWILGWDELFFDGSGPFYLFDHQTEQTTIMLWRLPHKPRRDSIVWLSNSTLLTNAGEYILYLDIANRLRHELLRDALSALADDHASMVLRLSADGEWLLVSAKDGSLIMRSVFHALAEVGYLESEWSETR